MSVLDTVAAGTSQWTIVDTLYFNSATHSFARADIEIDDSRIARILPPSTSRRAVALQGDSLACLPGVIDPDVGSNHKDWSACSQELVLRGVTTAGTFCQSPCDCNGGAGREGVRRFLYVELGESDGLEESIGVHQRGWERFQRIANEMASDRCELFPAVVPAEIWSAAALLTAASVSERLRRRLCIRLCSTELDAWSYKDTRFFTEVGLLSYLSLLTYATVFNLSQISRPDVLMLNESSANLVCAPGTLSDSLVERRYAPLSLKDRAIGFSINGDVVVADSNWHASLITLSMALTNQSDNAVEACNMAVDSLTRSAALALGVKDLGTIAADMKADLCLYDRPSGLREHCDSLCFIKLLAGGRPRHVLIDGTPVVVEGACARELAED